MKLVEVEVGNGGNVRKQGYWSHKPYITTEWTTDLEINMRNFNVYLEITTRISSDTTHQNISSFSPYKFSIKLKQYLNRNLSDLEINAASLQDNLNHASYSTHFLYYFIVLGIIESQILKPPIFKNIFNSVELINVPWFSWSIIESIFNYWHLTDAKLMISWLTDCSVNNYQSNKVQNIHF